MKHSPGEWLVLEVRGHKFVAAPAYEGHPHFKHTRFVDIAGSEDYPCKEADLKLIAAAPKMAALLLAGITHVTHGPKRSEVEAVLRNAGVL
jgi:hypothetical protein